MSNCEKYLDLISAYADGELTAHESAEIEAHLAECEECRSILETYRAISAEIFEDMEDVPADFSAGVMNRVSDYEIKRKNKKNNRKIAGRWIGAAACIAIILFAFPRMPHLGCGSSKNDAAMESTGSAMAGAADADCAMPEDDYSVTMDTATDMPSSDSGNGFSHYADSEAAEDMADGATGGTAGAAGSDDAFKYRSDVGMTVTLYSGEIPAELAESDYEVTYYENGDIEYLVPVSFAMEILSTLEKAEVEQLDTDISGMMARIIFKK